MTEGLYRGINPEIPRFTLAAFFTAPKPCEDALLDLGNAYNRLADQVEEAWAREAALLQLAQGVRDSWLLWQNGVDDAHLDSSCQDLDNYLVRHATQEAVSGL